MKLCSTGGFLCIIKILVLLLKYCIKNFSNLGYIFVKGKINFELLYYGLRNSEMFFKVRDKCYRWKEVGIYWRPVCRDKGRIKSRTRPSPPSLRQDKLGITPRLPTERKTLVITLRRKFPDSFAGVQTAETVSGFYEARASSYDQVAGAAWCNCSQLTGPGNGKTAAVN